MKTKWSIAALRIGIALFFAILFVCVGVFALVPKYASFAHLRSWSMIVGGFVLPLFLLLPVIFLILVLFAKPLKRLAGKKARIFLIVVILLPFVATLGVGGAYLSTSNVEKRIQSDHTYQSLMDYCNTQALSVTTSGYSTLLEPLSWEVLCSAESSEGGMRVSSLKCISPLMTQKYVRQIEIDFGDCRKEIITTENADGFLTSWMFQSAEENTIAIAYESEANVILFQIRGSSSFVGKTYSEIIGRLQHDSQ